MQVRHRQCQFPGEYFAISKEGRHVHFQKAIDPEAELLNDTYCIPSAQRRELIEKLGQILGIDKISVTLWTTLQVCDLKSLENTILKAAVSPEYILLMSNHLLPELPLLWLQKRPKELKLSHEDDSPSNKRKRQNQSAVYAAPKRDSYTCVLRKVRPVGACHIFPNFMIQPSNTQETYCSKFWDLLRLFWAPEKAEKWRSEIYSDPGNVDKAMDSCRNTISFSSEIY